MLKMHGDERAWSLLGCTCKLITRGFKQATGDASVEWRQAKIQDEMVLYMPCMFAAGARATAPLNYIEMS